MRRSYERDMVAIMGRVVYDDEVETDEVAALWDAFCERAVLEAGDQLRQLWIANGPRKASWGAADRRLRLALLAQLGWPDDLPVWLNVGGVPLCIGNAARLLPSSAPFPVALDDLAFLASVRFERPLPVWLARMVGAVFRVPVLVAKDFDTGGPAMR